MPFEHSPPANSTRSQRHQAVLTPIVWARLDCTPAVHQLSSNLDRGTPMYHERKKGKGINQEKKPPISGSNSSKPPQSSCSKKAYPRKNKKGRNFQVSKDKPHTALLTKDSKLICSEKERRIKEGLCTYCGGNRPNEKCFKRPENRQGSSRGLPSKQGKA
ncbi:hypothetical protein O181_066154 [Austropuccinia psidii MF-1]|uniref:Uncharacterized protein n=1 Tax=Austropuccinia psidii MF-1 TaxID=1389203 RepID=A0A9Q3ESG6_9BASI|nr:hypothetical protein [Austropuccinia psidii MF-1]